MHLACLSRLLSNKQDCMMQNRKRMWDDRQLQHTRTGCHKRALESSSSRSFAFLIAAALAFASCQAPPPPLPNPPGPKTAVRLSPGDTIKVAYADESVPDQTQKIRRDGKVSLPFIGEVTAAGKWVIDFQHELVSRYEGQLENSEVLVMLENGVATVIGSGFANRPGPINLDRPTT